MSIKCLLNGIEVNYPCSSVCALFGDCVTAFETQKKGNVRTNADRIRAMSDEELKYIARAVIKSEDCPMGETECTDCVFHDLCLRGEYYYYKEEEWLQQPAE